MVPKSAVQSSAVRASLALTILLVAVPALSTAAADVTVSRRTEPWA